eukprot:1355978-Alexandrium_andersonii.AAC.1
MACLRGRTLLSDRAALDLELSAGLRDTDCSASPFRQRALVWLNPHQPPGRHRLSLLQGVDCPGNLGE